MKLALMIVGLSALLSLSATTTDDAARKATDPVREIAKAKSLKIKFTVQNEARYLTISDPKTVKDFLSTIRVQDTQEGVHIALVAFGSTDFTLEDGVVKKALFSKPAGLYWSGWGLLSLKDDAFYKKVCEAASKQEGRQIDVLKNNK